MNNFMRIFLITSLIIIFSSSCSNEEVLNSPKFNKDNSNSLLNDKIANDSNKLGTNGASYENLDNITDYSNFDFTKVDADFFIIKSDDAEENSLEKSALNNTRNFEIDKIEIRSIADFLREINLQQDQNNITAREIKKNINTKNENISQYVENSNNLNNDEATNSTHSISDGAINQEDIINKFEEKNSENLDESFKIAEENKDENAVSLVNKIHTNKNSKTKFSILNFWRKFSYFYFFIIFSLFLLLLILLRYLFAKRKKEENKPNISNKDLSLSSVILTNKNSTESYKENKKEEKEVKIEPFIIKNKTITEKNEGKKVERTETPDYTKLTSDDFIIKSGNDKKEENIENFVVFSNNLLNENQKDLSPMKDVKEADFTELNIEKFIVNTNETQKENNTEKLNKNTSNLYVEDFIITSNNFKQNESKKSVHKIVETESIDYTELTPEDFILKSNEEEEVKLSTHLEEDKKQFEIEGEEISKTSLGKSLNSIVNSVLSPSKNEVSQEKEIIVVSNLNANFDSIFNRNNSNNLKNILSKQL